jgi:photosystem II stability/assembly factor-like uncharacterized protein
VGHETRYPQLNVPAACAFALCTLLPLFAADAAEVWNGPHGGMTFALAVDPSSPGTVYAGTSRGGIFKSADGGKHWRQVGAHPDAGTIRALTVGTGTETSTVYVAAGTAGIMRSTDGGRSWTTSTRGIGSERVRSFAVDSGTNPATVYAGTMTGRLFQSGDGGDSWSETPPPPGAGPIRVLAVESRTQPGALYAGRSEELYRRTIGGGGGGGGADGKWAQVAALEVLRLALHPKRPGTIFAGCPRGLFRSTDAGASWRSVRSIRRLWSLAIDGTKSPVAVYVGTAYDSVLKSADGGDEWTEAHTGLPRWGEVTELAIDTRSNPVTLYAATSHRGVHRSTDGGVSWHADEGAPGDSAEAQEGRAP